MMQNRKKRLVLYIQYDGSLYSGWQKQAPYVLTIQGLIEEVFERIFKEKITIIGSGRTDAGVHAKRQVAHFDTTLKYAKEVYLKALNANLPKDIRILKIFRKNRNFHARFSVKKKRYIYKIYNGPVCPVFICQYVYFLPKPYLNLTRLNEIFHRFVGKKDFKNFSIPDDERTTIRTIDAIQVLKKGHRFDIRIEGRSFLRKMVRMIVGFGLDIAIHQKNLQLIDQAFSEEKMDKVLRYPLPALGLCLDKVWY